MEGGKLAALFLDEAIKKGNYDEGLMKIYHQRWMNKFGFDFKWWVVKTNPVKKVYVTIWFFFIVSQLLHNFTGQLLFEQKNEILLLPKKLHFILQKELIKECTLSRKLKLL